MNTGVKIETTITPARIKKTKDNIRRFQHDVRVWLVRSLIATTPPISGTIKIQSVQQIHDSKGGVFDVQVLRSGPKLTQQAVRKQRQHILDYIQGPKGREYNWAYVNEKGDPVRSDYRHALPLVVPYPGQKRRPNRTVDALQWILQNTRLRYRPNGKTWRQIVNFPRDQVWTTRMSWRNAAKALSLRAGNMLSGWAAAGAWAAADGRKNPLNAVLPGNGTYGNRGEASGNFEITGEEDNTNIYIENKEIPRGKNFSYITDSAERQMEYVGENIASTFAWLFEGQ